MPYLLQWEQKPHIIFLKIMGNVSDAELVESVDQMIAMARETPEVLVHTLVDASEARRLPSLPTLGREFKRLLQASPNRNVSTLYGVSALVRFSLEVLMKITPVRLKVFPSREEALAFIHKMVESEQRLPDVTPLRADMRKNFPPSDEV